MGKFNTLLHLRLKSKESEKKVTALAERTSSGSLSSFSGVFKVAPLSEEETQSLSEIISQYQKQDYEFAEKDLQDLLAITSEVKAITNQAVLLHGERIKKAQDILKNYQDGAFSSWLIATYGNRQTPYNFLQYYELYLTLPKDLHDKLNDIPRQAIYTLASRSAPLEKKEEFIKGYEGQPKRILLSLIRKNFPIQEQDHRQPNLTKQVFVSLERLHDLIKHKKFSPSEEQKKEIEEELKEMLSLLKQV
jgi:hypothetical protein